MDIAGRYACRARHEKLVDAYRSWTSCDQAIRGFGASPPFSSFSVTSLVNVLLCDKVGDLALKSYLAPALRPKNVTPGQMLRGLLKQGGVAKVSALYLPNSEQTKDDLIESVGVAMPPEMADRLLDPKARTFTL